MNRTFLRLFYVFVQFVMLAVSIPKVATLFHAYDTQTMGPLIAGLDIRSWMVGIVIDLSAVFTTWAAMAKYDESRKRSTLLAPAGIILFCSGLSVIANYEDAATQRPEQYAHISLFSHPALLINPVMISAPPVLVLLLILLVPSVLAQPRIRTAAEIEAEAEDQEARIAADARIRQARAKANASVLAVRLQGIKETIVAVANRAEEVAEDEDAVLAAEVNEADEAALPPEMSPDDPAPSVAPAKITRAMWQAIKLPERVAQSGIITPQEVADTLGISLSHARNLTKEVESGTQKVDGRSGVSYNNLIDALYHRRSKDSFTWARKLETTLGVRKRERSLHLVVDDALDESISGGDTK